MAFPLCVTCCTRSLACTTRARPFPSIASSSAYKPPSVTLLKDCGFSHVTLVIGKEDHFLAESSNLNDFQRSMEELRERERARERASRDEAIAIVPFLSDAGMMGLAVMV